jgi:hypothetical protein
VLIRSLIGNPVRVGDGPAAVIGDERRTPPLFRKAGWEGAAGRMIQESEDLLEREA